MESNTKRKLVAGAAAALLVGGGGGALAASRFISPKEESQAVIADAAKQLGIAPSKLSDALKKALENRVDAAVAAGRLSKAEGDALKARIESGDAPLVPGGGAFHEFHHFGPGPGLDAAATYLGLTEAQLRTELESGKTLAQVATSHGKTVDGLVSALVDAAKQRLDAAVTAGRLTRSDADSLLAGLKDRITDVVNGRFPQPFGERHGMRGFRHGPPGLFGSA
jgi:hypothetical protein